MGKRGVAVSELSTVQKKPEYHADFVIWGFGTLCFYKGAKGNGTPSVYDYGFGTLCFYKGAKDRHRNKTGEERITTLCFCKGAKLHI